MPKDEKTSFLDRAALSMARALVQWKPKLVVEAVRAEGRDAAARWLNDPPQWLLQPAQLPKRVVGFEDLASLFWVSPLNAGALPLQLDEAALLFRSVGSLETPRGVEIGRGAGGATILLATAVGPLGRVTSIAERPQDDATLQATLEKSDLRQRVGLIKDNVAEIRINGLLDFAYFHPAVNYEIARTSHNRWAADVRTDGLAIYAGMANKRKLTIQSEPAEFLGEQLKAQRPAVFELVQEAGALAVWRRTPEPFQPLPPPPGSSTD